jgi:hypothetical protein
MPSTIDSIAADHLGKDQDVDNPTGTDVRALSEVLDVLDDLAKAAEGDAVSVEALVTTLGRRSFPTLVLAPSLIAVSPVSGIPGMASTIGLLVATITAQMLWGRQSAWLPGFLTRRRIRTARLRRALDWLRRPVGRSSGLRNRGWCFSSPGPSSFCLSR